MTNTYYPTASQWLLSALLDLDRYESLYCGGKFKFVEDFEFLRTICLYSSWSSFVFNQYIKFLFDVFFSFFEEMQFSSNSIFTKRGSKTSVRKWLHEIFPPISQCRKTGILLSFSAKRFLKCKRLWILILVKFCILLKAVNWKK